MRRNAAAATTTTADSERVLKLIEDVCRKAAAGDLEARFPKLGDSDQAKATRTALNGLLDNPAALAHDPVLIGRLRRLRSTRARTRRR